MKYSKYLLIFILFLVSQISLSSERGSFYEVDMYPKSLSSDCRDGVAKVYEECGSQMNIARAALAKANESDKTLLIVYGAEWCIWCHVFDKYVKGEYKKFSYVWEYDGEIQEWDMREKENKKSKDQAKKLNKYVSENFVVAHIEGYFSPDGLDVIDAIGFDSSNINFLPFIFSVTKSGKYADHMLAASAIPGLEIRKDSGVDYRGFDREILIEELVKLKNAAESG